MVRKTLFACFLVAVFSVHASAQQTEDGSEPALTSVFPLGGARGSRFDAIVRGVNLEGAYAVWFDADCVKAQIKEGREIKPRQSEANPEDAGTTTEPQQQKKYEEVVVGVQIDISADLGAHALHLVTPRGVSDSLWFLVDSDPVVSETDKPHSTLADAQSVTFPVIVNGKLGKPGEVDFYAFEVQRAQELEIEVRVTNLSHKASSVGAYSADPQLTLYKPGGSWFDPNHGIRLESNDLWRPPPGEFPYTTFHRLPRVTRFFQEPGCYIAKVTTLNGVSGPDYSYQLRIVPVDRAKAQELERQRWGPLVPAPSTKPIFWKRRSFTAEISTDWLSRIWERSASNDVAPKAPGVQSEKEPNDSPPQAFDVPVPAIIEGTIDRPGDADWFGFEAKEGDRLAFEVETPYLPPPFFNPLLSVFDQEGRELVDNIYRATDACGGEGIKTLMPSTLFRIEKAGRYRIRIQDLTARVGGAKFAYRVLIRRQIAYLGEVSASELDRISLQARGSRSVNLAAEFEEGFAGEAVVSVENLPPGISAATKFSASGKGDAPASKPGNPTHKERYMPERRSVEIMLIAAANAPATVLPQPIRIVARPIMNGKVGAALPAQEILLTVSGRKEQTNAALR